MGCADNLVCTNCRGRGEAHKQTRGAAVVVEAVEAVGAAEAACLRADACPVVMCCAALAAGTLTFPPH